jgi:arylsulfatase A-like enzyme
MMGKWHLGNILERSPTARGFDEFFGFWGGLHAYNKQSPGFNMVRRGTEPAGDFGYLTDAFGREAAAFVDHHHDKPFFLYLAFNAVHQPLQAPPKYLERFPDTQDPKRRRMLAVLSAMDDAVGQLLAQLREHKLEENTLIFFLSDNGGPSEGNTSLNTPFSGYKSQLFEGGIREPFFAQWKGHIAPGQTLDQPVISLDIFSTALAVAGATPPNDRPIDGVNLLPLLEGKQAGPVHDRLFWRYAPQWAVREGDWKLMGLKDRAKLFNLAKDPAEKHDLAGEHPDVVQRLKTAYATWEKQLTTPMWPTDPTWNMDDQEFDRQEDPHTAHARRTGSTAPAND